MTRGLTVALGLALFASAMTLVVSQYLVHSRTADLEEARHDTRALEMETARLSSELRRLAQPATVVAVARNWGMKDITPDQTVVLAGVTAAAVAQEAR
jgi:cell division protein FtsL